MDLILHQHRVGPNHLARLIAKLTLRLRLALEGFKIIPRFLHLQLPLANKLKALLLAAIHDALVGTRVETARGAGAGGRDVDHLLEAAAGGGRGEERRALRGGGSGGNECAAVSKLETLHRFLFCSVCFFVVF